MRFLTWMALPGYVGLQTMVAAPPSVVELLTGGVVVTLLIIVLNRQAKLQVDVATLTERLAHVPTKDEVAGDLRETRHLLRNLITEVQDDLDQQIASLREESP